MLFVFVLNFHSCKGSYVQVGKLLVLEFEKSGDSHHCRVVGREGSFRNECLQASALAEFGNRIAYT